ncbi:flagellar hook-length control protein FliK [Consotaella aegiceratis]|uniref:flagellar hook-length control protein FliK n=1 Tax=Consotaella aegiceratis TaxID=3097961 RepID=UPI002F40EAA7
MTIALTPALIEAEVPVQGAKGRGSHADKKTAGEEFHRALDESVKDAVKEAAKPSDTEAASQAAQDEADVVDDDTGLPGDAKKPDRDQAGEVARTFGARLAEVLCASYAGRSEGMGQDVVRAAPDQVTIDHVTADQMAPDQVAITGIAQAMQYPAIIVADSPAAEGDSAVGSASIQNMPGDLIDLLKLDDSDAVALASPDLAETDSLESLSSSLGLKMRAALGQGDGSMPRLKVDVVHMETHFEPNADQAVVLENASSARNLSVRAGDAQQAGALAGAMTDETESDDAPSDITKTLATLGRSEEAAVDGDQPARARTVEGAAVRTAEVDQSAKTRARNTTEASAQLSDKPAVKPDTVVQNGATGGGAQPETGSGNEEASEGSLREKAPVSDTPRTAGQAKDGASTTSTSTSTTKAVNASLETVVSGDNALTTQVANRIISALNPTGRAEVAQRPQSETGLALKAGGAALKTMLIQLQPEHLGQLEVSMRLVDGELSVELAASEPETAQHLANDRDSLRKLLQGAGFSLDDASIKIVARDNLAARSDAGSATGGQSNGNGATDNSRGEQSADSQSSRQQQSRGGERQPSHDDEASAPHRARGSSVYL